MAAQAVIKRHSGESEMEFQSRKVRTLDLREQANRPLVNEFQERQGDYRDRFIHHDETGTKAQAKVNRASTVLDKWMADGGIGFEAGAITAIGVCVFYWERMGSQKLTADYEHRIPGGLNGTSADEARDEMARIKAGIPRPYWDVFENVVRHRLPAGVAGSDMAENPAQSIASAKAIVGMVANLIAMREGY